MQLNTLTIVETMPRALLCCIGTAALRPPCLRWLRHPLQQLLSMLDRIDLVLVVLLLGTAASKRSSFHWDTLGRRKMPTTDRSVLPVTPFVKASMLPVLREVFERSQPSFADCLRASMLVDSWEANARCSCRNTASYRILYRVCVFLQQDRLCSVSIIR